MLERTIEAHLVKRVADAGGIAYKFTSPSRRSVPDRLVLMPGKPVPPRHDGGTGYFTQPRAIFVELKAPGKKPTPAQEREHERLRALGFQVEVIDSLEGVLRFVEGLG